MRFLSLLALGCTVSVVSAADLQPAEKPIESVIDHYVDATLADQKITPAPRIDDATLIRRLTLDLIGRIPTPDETKTFVESKETAKRAKLVDRLLASPAYVRHQATQFDAMFANSNMSKSGGLRDYFVTALTENRPWNQIFRELMLPDPADPKQKVASEFLRTRVTDLDRLTNDVSVLFFGVNVSCAQCHNHPLVEDWKQDHFYGMKSFFVRTFDNGGFVGERELGLVKFKPTKGPERNAKMMFLSGKVIDTPTLREPTPEEKKKEQEKFDKAKNAKTAPASPSFSARQTLVETALQPGESDYFSKSIANRIWHRYFGFGLVSPLDQMHSANPASHPELLRWLARDVATHQYDLRRLTRGIVMSQAYSRSSKYDGKTIPDPKYFAVARLKPLAPQPLATSMKIAVTDPTGFENLKPEELEKKLEAIESTARGFASQIAQPTDDFQIGINEALLFSNHPRILQEFLTDASGTLLGKLKQCKEPKEAIELMVRSTLSRNPTSAEMKVFLDYFAVRGDRPAEAYRQMLWALITSSEFRFNY